MIDAASRGLRTLLTDAGVRATVISRLIALGGAPITLYLAATRLPANEQGWYFVAINIVAFAQVCELGLGTIIVQFASHEWPRLRWGRGGGLEGDPSARDSIAALLVTATRWFGAAAVALFVIAGLGGALIFGSNLGGSRLSFVVLWLGFVAVTALYLLAIPFVSVSEGCGDLLAVQRMRAWQAAAILVALWIGILMSGPLTAAWLAAAAQLLVAAIWLFTRHRGLLRAPRKLPATLFDGVKGLAGKCDPALSALIADLKDRGLFDKTLVMWTGEFGRTPKINPRTGRDHWPRNFNALLAGGGIQGGQVIGETAKDGMGIVNDPVNIPDLFSTICKSLDVNPAKENMSPIGRPLKIVDGGKPVTKLFG